MPSDFAIPKEGASAHISGTFSKPTIALTYANQIYSVGIATKPEDLAQIYKLRKEVYVDELNYTKSNGSEYLIEELDSYSDSFYVKCNDVLIGSARFTSQLKGQLELSKDINWEEHMRKDRVYCEITRLLLKNSKRNFIGSTLIFKALYEHCLLSGVNAIVCYWCRRTYKKILCTNWVYNGKWT